MANMRAGSREDARKLRHLVRKRVGLDDAAPVGSERSAHPLADQLPMMSAAEFEALKTDIKTNGLKEPILLYEGQILDGRNRAQACKETGVEPVYKNFEGTYEEAARLSASANLLRRHLSKSQQAMFIVTAGLAAAPNTVGSGKDSVRDASKRYGVNHVTIYKAFYVLENDKDMAAKVLNGDLSVGKAEADIRARTVAATTSRERGVSSDILRELRRADSQLANFDRKARQELSKEVRGLVRAINVAAWREAKCGVL